VAQGLWDFLLYSRFSPIYEVMKPNKLNPRYPKFAQVSRAAAACTVVPRRRAPTPPAHAQFMHDAFWATMSTLISSVFEVGDAVAPARLAPVGVAPSRCIIPHRWRCCGAGPMGAWRSPPWLKMRGGATGPPCCG